MRFYVTCALFTAVRCFRFRVVFGNANVNGRWGSVTVRNVGPAPIYAMLLGPQGLRRFTKFEDVPVRNQRVHRRRRSAAVQ